MSCKIFSKSPWIGSGCLGLDVSVSLSAHVRRLRHLTLISVLRLRTRTHTHSQNRHRPDSCSHVQRCVKCGNPLRVKKSIQPPIFALRLLCRIILCGYVEFTHPVHHFDTWVSLFRAHKSLRLVQPASQPVLPCRSDSFCLASDRPLSILSHLARFKGKGFLWLRSQVKQMSGDDRIRARRSRNFVARTDADTDMTRARRRGQQRAWRRLQLTWSMVARWL